VRSAAEDEVVSNGADRRRVFRVGFVTTAALAAIAFGLILATLNRGFDWTDEGFVYAMISSNRVAEGEVWGFQHILHPLFALLGDSVLAFRILRLVGYVALSVVLVFGARRIARRLGILLSRGQWLFILLFAQVGTFAAWGYPPRYLGYNEVASWLAQAGAVLILVLLTDVLVAPDRAQWRTAGMWFGLGVIIAVITVVKITSGAVFGVLVLAAVLVPTSSFAWWKRLLTVAAGGVLGIGVVWALGFPLVGYLRSAYHLLTDSSAQAASDHSLAAMIPTYLESARLTLWYVSLPVALVAVVTLVLFRSRSGDGSGVGAEQARQSSLLTRGLWTLAVVAVVTVYAIPAGLAWNQIGVAVAFLGGSGFAILVILGDRLVVGADPAPRRRAVIIVAAVIVALTPFISAVGTNNAIMGSTVFSATTWAVLFGFALCAMWTALPGRRGGAGIPLMLGASAMAIFVVFVVNDVFMTPYRTVPYFQQHDVVDEGPLRGLRLTAEEAELADWLAQAAEAESAVDAPAVAISAPGALLAFNQSGWANPWVDAMWPVSFASVARACEDGTPDGLLVLQPDSETTESASYQGFVGALASCGIDFPEDFEEIAHTPSGMEDRALTIWRLSDR